MYYTFFIIFILNLCIAVHTFVYFQLFLAKMRFLAPCWGSDVVNAYDEVTTKILRLQTEGVLRCTQFNVFYCITQSPIGISLMHMPLPATFPTTLCL